MGYRVPKKRPASLECGVKVYINGVNEASAAFEELRGSFIGLAKSFTSRYAAAEMNAFVRGNMNERADPELPPVVKHCAFCRSGLLASDRVCAQCGGPTGVT